MPNLVASSLMFALAGLGALVGVFPWLFVGLPLILGVLLFLNLLFDLATVRYGLHPAEALPSSRADLSPFDLMRSRKSCRSFQKRKLTDAHRETLLSRARMHSQAENCIGTHPIRFEYVSAPLNVWPVVGCTEFLVAIAERDYHEEAILDVGRSLQKTVLDATRLGIATCWIGPGANPSSVARHLRDRFDPEKDHVICVCALGYASRYKALSIRFMQKSQRWRLPVDDLFFSDPECVAPINVSAEPYSAFERCFECCQWSPSSYNAQPTRAVVFAENGEIERVDFLAATKSRYYAIVALGIWIANWEFGCGALGVSGHIARISDHADRRPELPRYVMSWVRET